MAARPDRVTPVASPRVCQADITQRTPLPGEVVGERCFIKRRPLRAANTGGEVAEGGKSAATRRRSRESNFSFGSLSPWNGFFT
jgi:hypothetical protein